MFLAIFVGAAAGYLGSLMVLEKMALVGDALSHVALPGLALGTLLHFNPYIGALAFLFVTAIIIWQIQRTTKISFEALVGAMFTLALALGILLYGNELEALEEALFGDISQVTLMSAGIAAVVCVVAIVLTKVIYDKLVLVMISEDLAVSKGIKVARTNLLYLFLVSVVVAIGIQIVGTLLVGFLVIVPAIAAKNLSTYMKRYALLSAVFGIIAASGGVLLWNFVSFNLPFPGPMVVFVGIAIFVVSLIINWRLKITS
ncbi:metal ABC transporter permease [Candidatus Bathycorpusculum sp.]|uniref:metal ABC transporter permease n=1 Tax=Candidatus Bathycorpusculum sp. TaxID=2994959 RepID=UPI00282FB723|nr:metal ABC transporter permease [Candidatus Termitimicrobium sp.]MDR0471533.1 metal ABC transporter permease [Nitrososphaerota archaeon]